MGQAEVTRKKAAPFVDHAAEELRKTKVVTGGKTAAPPGQVCHDNVSAGRQQPGFIGLVTEKMDLAIAGSNYRRQEISKRWYYNNGPLP